jgi:hypothetical protein
MSMHTNQLKDKVAYQGRYVLLLEKERWHFVLISAYFLNKKLPLTINIHKICTWIAVCTK